MVFLCFSVRPKSPPLQAVSPVGADILFPEAPLQTGEGAGQEAEKQAALPGADYSLLSKQSPGGAGGTVQG